MISILPGIPAIWVRRLSGCSTTGFRSLVRVLVLLLLPAQLSAQTPARPLAPLDHWTRGVLRRIALDGSIDAGAATAAWPLREDALALLLSSADSARGARPDTSAAARSSDALSGFATQFGLERKDLVNDPRFRLGARMGLRPEGRWDVLHAGTSVPDATGYFYPGPVPVDDRREIGVGFEVDAAWRLIALRAARGIAHDGFREAYMSASFGRVVLWGGRRGLSFGATPRGGIVLGAGARFDGGGFETAEPFRLPWFLDALGDVRISQTIARMERSGDITHPWFLATRISFAPHERFALGLNRAAIFGGEGTVGVTARRVLLMLLGFSDVSGKDSDFENQVASVDAYWRPPASLPIALYAEYGTEDTGLAFVHVPAIIVGVEAAPRRGGPWSGSLEHVRFARSTRTYPEWYRHGALGGGWSDDGELLGHPLGGHGHETSLGVRYDSAPRRFSGGVRIVAKNRDDENLFAPDREGGAFGGDADVVWFPAAGVTARLVGSAEGGGGWCTGNVRVAVMTAF